MEVRWTVFGMNPVKFNAPWHRLRHTWVGATYPPIFFEPIKNQKIRESLQKIARETEEDYENLINVLQQFGVHVSRPVVAPGLTIMDFIDTQGHLNYAQAKSFTLIPRPPMQPRDSLLIVGETMIGTSEECKWFYPDCARAPFDFDAPMVTVIGHHIISDCKDDPWLPIYLQEKFPDRTIVPVLIGGHNDAVFCPVRPGLIVSTYHHDNYTETFPGWEVKFITNQSWNAIPGWRQTKHANVGKWWVPDDDNNPEFAQFVDTWLGHWLGFVGETVFDVNMLQIDEHTILVNNYNSEMFNFFASRGIEPIITPFRHRFFWDGGIHCVTGDVYREGPNEVYINTR